MYLYIHIYVDTYGWSPPRDLHLLAASFSLQCFFYIPESSEYTRARHAGQKSRFCTLQMRLRFCPHQVSLLFAVVLLLLLLSVGVFSSFILVLIHRRISLMFVCSASVVTNACYVPFLRLASVCVYIYTHTPSHVFVYTVSVCVCVCVCVHIHVYICTHACIWIHTRTYVELHTLAHVYL